MRLDCKNDSLTKQEVADMFRVSLMTITRWVNQGKLHPIKFGTTKQSHILFTKQDIKEFMNKNKKGE